MKPTLDFTPEQVEQLTELGGPPTKLVVLARWVFDSPHMTDYTKHLCLAIEHSPADQKPWLEQGHPGITKGILRAMSEEGWLESEFLGWIDANQSSPSPSPEAAPAADK